MKREYWLQPSELSGEKILEVLLKFQDKDIPISQEDVDRFFQGGLDNLFESDDKAFIMSELFKDMFIRGSIEDVVVLNHCGVRTMLGDSLIILPKIIVRVIE